MRNQFFFEIAVNQEQVAIANQLVEYSIKNHPVEDVFSQDPQGAKRQREFRFTGTLGELIFADAYKLPRPTRSFGALDGQDYGRDFSLDINHVSKSLDVKSMRRKHNKFKTNYVLNIPAYQLHKKTSLTDYYFCISLHQNASQYVASFLGYISKQEIINETIGVLYYANTERTKDDGTSFIFQRDTYEIDFKDISSPILTYHIQTLPGFQQKKLQESR